MTSRKQQVQELANDIHRSVALEAIMIKRIVGLMLDEAKDKLINAQGDDLLRCQGEAQVLKRLHKDLTVTSPTGMHQE